MKAILKVLVLVLLVSCVSGQDAAPPVELKSVEQGEGIEVWIGGKLFTAYRFGEGFADKPVFYPIMSPRGVMINREIPFDDEALRESQDHPHHQSLFFGYGNVDGSDFWSTGKGETIVHQAILEREGNRIGFLASWNDPQGKTLVEEVRHVTFGGSGDVWWMDHDITLLAQDEAHAFNDTKEGMFALRVAESLREDKGSGRYVNTYGWETTEQVWGKRAPWVALRGQVEGQDVTIAIFDHPTTFNYPSYWHARGYGLFAVNPFGRKDFVEGSEALGSKLAAYGSYHFRYRVLIYGARVEMERLARDYHDYIK